MKTNPTMKPLPAYKRQQLKLYKRATILSAAALVLTPLLGQALAVILSTHP
jgi:hypothetical protein